MAFPVRRRVPRIDRQRNSTVVVVGDMVHGNLAGWCPALLTPLMSLIFVGLFWIRTLLFRALAASHVHLAGARVSPLSTICGDSDSVSDGFHLIQFFHDQIGRDIAHPADDVAGTRASMFIRVTLALMIVPSAAGVMAAQSP
jgi:hypothetical protein